jgi:glycosyltransferase involved in cell wall biosynthesis
MEKKPEEILLTVFTPAYNRADLLHRAYESLKRQTRKDFIWLIVDDGSLDDTMEAVRGFKNRADFEIIYKYTENGGKMRAHNLGAEMCSTELILCLDSDDYLTDDAVEIIYDTFGEALKDFSGKEGGQEKGLAGIVAHKGRDKITPLYNDDFPAVVFSDKNPCGKPGYTTLYGLYLQGFKGETTLVYRAHILKEYPFPEIKGEKYVPEDYIYDKIDGNYLLKAVPKVLTVCELVENGYTDSLKRLKKENPVGWYLYYEQRARITPPSVLKLKYAGYYTVYAYRTGNLRESSLPFVWRAAGLFAALLLKLTGKE